MLLTIILILTTNFANFCNRTEVKHLQQIYFLFWSMYKRYFVWVPAPLCDLLLNLWVQYLVRKQTNQVQSLSFRKMVLKMTCFPNKIYGSDGKLYQNTVCTTISFVIQALRMFAAKQIYSNHRRSLAIIYCDESQKGGKWDCCYPINKL